MTMTLRLSKLMLISHITFSVGWLGAVVVFLALAVTGLTTQDVEIVKASLIAMKLSAWLVIVPFCIISLFTGIIQAAGTKWGLFKHYWIVVKLFLTVASTILLLLHMPPINFLAGLATADSISNTQLAEQLIDITTKAGVAILVLIAITTISVYKPWGKIKFRFDSNIQKDVTHRKTKSLGFYLLISFIVLIVIFIIMHLLGYGMGH